MFVRRPVFLLALIFTAILSYNSLLFAGIAEELGDVSLPDGVDAADVQRMLGLIAGEETPNAKDLERGDVAPGSLPDANKPGEVQPNLEPDGTFNVGDAVLIARRAAGDIIFVGINDKPRVTLEGDGDVVGSATYTLSGTVTDDQDVSLVTMEIFIGETKVVDGLAVQNDGSFSTSITLNSGDNEVKARGTDGLLKVGDFAVITVAFDDIKPVVSITSPEENEYVKSNPLLVTGTVEDAYDITNVKINGINASGLEKIGGIWSFNGYVNLGLDGPKTITVVATDQVGNLSEETSVNCYYDGTLPTVTITQNFDNPNNATSLTLTGSATDNSGIIEVRVNGDLATYNDTTDTWSILVDIVAGENSFVASATDLAGNVGQSAETLIEGDYDPPVLTLQSATIVGSTPYEWIIGINEPVKLISMNGVANGSSFSGNTINVTGWELVEGENDVIFIVDDLAGNRTTETFTVILDTVDPIIVITEISRDSYTFMEDPQNGVDGGITNAPNVVVSGTVSDTNGVASVTVNGYDAQVSEGTFTISGLPLIPRANTIVAVATDQVGNSGSHSITVYQDVEGPSITLTDFDRGAYVANQGEFVNPAKRIYDGSDDLVVHGTLNDLYVNITGLTGTFGSTPLTINMNKEDSSSFSFTIPYSSMKLSRLNLLNLVATDELGNVNEDYNGALTGDFAARGEVVENGIGAAVSSSAMGFISRTVEDIVEAMDGSTLVNVSEGFLGIDVDVYGIAFCHPPSPFSGPSGTMSGTFCQFGCYQDVYVDMSIDGDGYLDILISIDYLYVDLKYRGWIDSCHGYASAKAVVNLKADFVTTNGVISIVPIGSPSVNVSGLDIDLDGCSIVDGLLELFEGFIEGYIEDAFEDMIGDLLDSVTEQFTSAAFEFENTGFKAYVADVTNDKKGLQIWMDFYGSPCPNKTSQTNSGDACPDPVAYPQAQDIYDSPGFLVTPNPDDSGRAFITMKDNNLVDHSFEAVLNDDLINYLLYAEWAQGTLDMSITQEMVGDVLGLDTASFGIFIPELINPVRTDVQAIAPTGTPITIQMHPILPIVAKGVDKLNEDHDAIQIQAGDIILSFIGDVDQNGSFETPLFDMAISMFAEATLVMNKPSTPYGTDYVSIELGEPTIYTDLAWSAFVMDEEPLRNVIPSIFNLVLPMFLESLERIDLPGSLVRVSSIRVIDPGAEFISLVGEIQTSIAITGPVGPVVTGDLDIEGIVSNIEVVNGEVSVELETYVNGIAQGNKVKFFREGTDDKGRIDGFIDERDLVEGENTIRVVVTDLNNYDGEGTYATSYQTMIVDYAYSAANSRWETTIVSGISNGGTGNPIEDLMAGFGDLDGCLGCQNQDVSASTVLLVLLFGVIGMIIRRRKLLNVKSISSMTIITLMLVSTMAFSGCLGGDDGKIKPDGDVENDTVVDGDLEGNIDGDIDKTDNDVDGDKTDADTDIDGDEEIDTDAAEDETETDEDFDQEGETDGDKDDDVVDVDYIDGDYENDFDAPPNDFNGPDIDDDPVIILNTILLGGKDDGFNLDEGRSPEGDPDPDNGLNSLSGLANTPLQEAIDDGDILLLLKFVGMTHLPAAGESGYVDILGYFGEDEDDDPSNNFDGNQTFGIDPSSFDENGELLVQFINVRISADETGKISIHGGPTLFALSIPLSEGVELTLTITETQIAGLLEESALRAGGIGLNEGLLGGIIPCEILAQPLEALGGLAPLMFVAGNVDIDLNRDGVLDTTNHLENRDGITAGIVIGGVPAFLDDGSANLAPTIEISPNTPPIVSIQQVTIEGVIADPDGLCENALVTVKSGDFAAVEATVTKNVSFDNCSFSAPIEVVLGDNSIVAKVTDEREAEATDSVSIELYDNAIPTVSVVSPANGSDVTEANITLSGFAMDNYGILGVEVAVENGETYAALGTELGPNGEFAIDITLPQLDSNTIRVEAKDLSGKLSGKVVHRLNLMDVDPPELVLTEVSDGEITVEPPDPLFVHRPNISMSGNVNDNSGPNGVMVYYKVPDKSRTLCMVMGDKFNCDISDLEFGANSISLISRDIKSNEEAYDYVVTFTDNKAPVITVTAPNAVVNVAEQTLRFSITDDMDSPDTMTPTVSLNEAVAVNANWDEIQQDFYLDLVLEQRDGNNSVYIEVLDASSNVGSTTAIIELQDVNAPVLTVTAPDDLSEIMEETVVVTGTVTDDLQLAEIPVVIEIGNNSYDVEVIDGEFSQQVDLELGLNTITTTAYDFSGRVDSDIRTVTRLDPGVPDTLSLTADPATLLVGTDPSTLTATVKAITGEPVPSGTSVTFSMSPVGAGVLTDSVTMETESITVETFDATGIVNVVFNPGATPEVVTITATAGDAFDTTKLILLDPTMALLRVCTDGTENFAGTSMSISYSGDANVNTPFSGSLSAMDLAEGFHTYNGQQPNPMLLWAGTTVINSAGAIGEFSWSLGGGVPAKEEFSLSPATISDLLGVIQNESSDAFDICRLDLLLGDLPPVVNLDPLPAVVNDPNVTITASIQDANLAGCTGTLTVNGTSTIVDVSSGTLSHDIVLLEGENTVLLEVVDPNSNLGSDSLTVGYTPYNAQPDIIVTAPGSSTGYESVVVEGTVSDDGPITDVTVRVRVAEGSWIACSLSDNGDGSGTFLSSASLPLVIGNNTIQVEAVDALLASRTINHAVYREPPVPAPIITINEPAENTQITTNPVALSGTISEGGDPSLIVVSLTVDGSNHDIIWQATTRTFNANITLEEGDHTIVVRAENNSGFDEETRHVSYSLPDDAPEIAITYPADGASFAAGSVLMQGTIEDDRPFDTLQSFKVNGVDALVFDESEFNGNYSASWSANVPLTEGSNTLTAEAIDRAGNSSGLVSITVTNVAPPAIVLDMIAIGSASDGFNVDQIGLLGDLTPDNALSGLGTLANPLIGDQLDAGEMLIILEITGMTQLPGPGQSVTVDVIGYIGEDADGNPNNNFGGSGNFNIKPDSFDEFGNPIIKFDDVTFRNSFGQLVIDTYADNNPAVFAISVEASDEAPALTIQVSPAYLRASFTDGPNGLELDESLLGGVVPAGTLAMDLEFEGLSINPLGFLMRDSATDPVPDVDLNEDGVLATTNPDDVSPANPDGISVGIKVSGVPCTLNH